MDVLRKLQSLSSLYSQPTFPEIDDECCVIDYGDTNTHWITYDYLNLRVRCASLIAGESNTALKKHFANRLQKKLAKKQDSEACMASGETARRLRETVPFSTSKDEFSGQSPNGYNGNNAFKTLLSMGGPIVWRPSLEESLLIAPSNYPCESFLEESFC